MKNLLASLLCLAFLISVTTARAALGDTTPADTTPAVTTPAVTTPAVTTPAAEETTTVTPAETTPEKTAEEKKEEEKTEENAQAMLDTTCTSLGGKLEAEQCKQFMQESQDISKQPKSLVLCVLSLSVRCDADVEYEPKQGDVYMSVTYAKVTAVVIADKEIAKEIMGYDENEERFKPGYKKPKLEAEDSETEKADSTPEAKPAKAAEEAQ